MIPRPPAIVFCERLDNESFCASIVRELSRWYDVRPCGPGWPVADLPEVDARGARFYLELDAASGNFVRPTGLDRLDVPKFAWLIDTHKKPSFHRELSAGMDLTFHAMATWGQVLEGQHVWLPVHCDQELFRHRECEREWDVVFVGSQAWRADPVRRIADRYGFRIHVACTTGPREKSQTADLYARTKVVFNRHVTNDLNFRTVEAMACGRALLTDAQWNGQYELFEDERHYLLYKDERDLERQLVRLIEDDELRTRIEREAAALAHAQHTTRVRVRQLHEAIEGFLGQRGLTPVEVRTPPRRWLVLAGERPATIEQASLSELCARALAREGHEVVLAVSSPEPPLFPPPAAAPGAPKVVHLHQGPLPRRGQGELGVEPAAALVTGLARVAEELGPFDAVLGEGALAGLVAQPVAAQLERPFVLALPRCEVRRRSNHLTREQLYVAELEHWACDKAALVITGSATVAEAVRRHYQARNVASATPSRKPIPRESEGLLGELEVEGGALLLFGAELSAADAERLLDPPDLTLDHDVVLLAGETWHRNRYGALRRLSRSPAAGPALAALVGSARAIVGLDPDDPRLEEARILGARVVAVDPHPLDLRRLLAAADGGRTAPAEEGQDVQLAAALNAVCAMEMASAVR